MMKFLIIIIFFVSSILSGGNLKNERSMNLSTNENVVVEDTLIDNSENTTDEFLEKTNEETGVEVIESNTQEPVVQEIISGSENTIQQQQYQEPVYVPETNVVQEQEVQETLQETKESQEESVIVMNPREEAIEMNEQKPEKTEEYRYNAEMTQKMIDMINNNPNENMLEFGYTVTVDSSVKELSNPFTYTDERMLVKIQRKWGNIRVYAEDYYLNGNYFGTDCYIY